jgi:hypothetical protein
MFRKVTTPEFKEWLAASDASQTFRKQYARYISFDPFTDTDAMVNDGDVRAASFKAPALCTLILGDLIVDDVVDLQTPYDEGRLFVVIGNVRCRHFINEYGTNCFVDGNLEASQAILNGFEDASLNVIGDLKTKLFIGCDICAEVGGATDMDYGVGYALPLGYTDAGRQSIRPRHDEDATVGIVTRKAQPEGYVLDAQGFADLIRAGRPIFK